MNNAVGVRYLCSGIRTKIQGRDIIVIAGDEKGKTISVFRPATHSWLFPLIVFTDGLAESILAVMVYSETVGLIKRIKTYECFRKNFDYAEGDELKSYQIL